MITLKTLKITVRCVRGASLIHTCLSCYRVIISNYGLDRIETEISCHFVKRVRVRGTLVFVMGSKKRRAATRYVPKRTVR